MTGSGRRASSAISISGWATKISLGGMVLAMTMSSQASARHKFLECNTVSNARILASDGTFLGSLSPASRPDSVLNKTGPYGSRTAGNGLWNINGPYGSISSEKSPMNGAGGRPASVVKDGKEVGKLMRGSLRTWIEDPAKLVQRCYGFQP